MKSLLILLLLLVPTTFCLPNAFSRGSCLQHINAARSAFADKLQLANMNALVYNKKLEKKALEQLSYSGPCPQPSIISQNHLDAYLNVKGHDLIVDLLSATGSTQMACVRSKCGDEDVISIVTDVQDSPPISGPPGTQCSSERLANSQGLCTQEYFRGGYARKFSFGGVLDSIEDSMRNMPKARKGIFEDIVKFNPPIVKESEEDAVTEGPISIAIRETIEEIGEIMKNFPAVTSKPVRKWDDELVY